MIKTSKPKLLKSNDRPSDHLCLIPGSIDPRVNFVVADWRKSIFTQTTYSRISRTLTPIADLNLLLRYSCYVKYKSSTETRTQFSESINVISGRDVLYSFLF